jgi:ammonium transporter, Amt family
MAVTGSSITTVVAQAPFPEQVTVDQLAINVLYVVAACAVLLIIAGLAMVEAGLVAKRNFQDVVLQKMGAALIGGMSFAIVGYGIWNWQFYTALEVPNAFSQAIKDWWIGGSAVNELSHRLDPAVVPHADSLQIFLAFNIAFGALVCALIHSVGIERMKPAATYTICALVGGIVFPFTLYLTWGSASPLTAAGTHDYVGLYAAYIFVGVFGLFLVWRLGPRLGAFRAHPRTPGPVPNNLGLTAIGVLIMLFAIPLLVLGCGYFAAEAGYNGISMSESAIGVVFNNVFVALCGGGITGLLLAYRTKNSLFFMLGPLAGYVSGAAAFDVVTPLEMFLISLPAPLFMYGVYKLLYRFGLDERRIIPLGLGAGVYGVLIVGIVEWGTPTGGYFGIEEGTYAFLGAEINLWWQLIGLVSIAAIALVSAVVIVLGVEKTIGLRITEEQEIEGLDLTYWPTPIPRDDGEILVAGEPLPEGAGARAAI